jgi:hypothetical protein
MAVENVFIAAIGRKRRHRRRAVTQCCTMSYGQPNMAHCTSRLRMHRVMNGH